MRPSDVASTSSSTRLPEHFFRPLRYFSLSVIGSVLAVVSVGSLMRALFTVFPWTVCYMLYLNYACWPPKALIDFGNLTIHGVEGRNLYLNQNNVTLGVWIVNPERRNEHPAEKFDFDQQQTQDMQKSTPDLSDLPVILYVHGNAGSRAEFCRVRLYANLRRLGFTVVAFDYRGYGDSTGSPWGEQDLVEDSFAVYQHIRRTFPTKEVLIWGHSLGTGVSTHLVQMIEQHHLPIAGLILDSPFSDLDDAMRRHPLLRPLHLVPGFTDSVASAMKTMEVNMNNSAAVLTLKSPVLILHAEDDTVVPVELGRKLYEAAKSGRSVEVPVELVTFGKELGYGHRGIYRDPQLPKIVEDFVAVCRKYNSSFPSAAGAVLLSEAVILDLPDL